MGEAIRVCGVGILGTVAAVLLRTAGRDAVLFPLRLAAAVMIYVAALGILSPVVTYLSELAGDTGLSDTVRILFTALGVTVLVRFCAGVCRENGEGGIASALEFAGRCVILAACVPVIREMLCFAAEVGGGV